MHVNQLKLTTFRNIQSATLNFDDAKIVALYGKNGAGKTNLLEALSMLSPGKGLHKAKLENQINNKAKSWGVFSKIEHHEQNETTLGMLYSKKNRIVKIDGNKLKNQSELAALGNILWFTPKMDRLFLDASQARRDFLDRLTFGYIPTHAGTLARYKHHLKSRMELLKSKAAHDWVEIEEQNITKHALQLIKNRNQYIKNLQKHLPEVKLEITGSAHKILEADDMETEYITHLQNNRQRDGMYNTTNFGPHRSNLSGEMFLGEQSTVMLEQSSTGQHKRSILFILLAHSRLMFEKTGNAPVILLDEITAHLDKNVREHFFAELEKLNAQIFLTGTEKNLFTELFENKKCKFFEVSNGNFVDTTN